MGEGRAYKGLSGNQNKVGVTKMSRGKFTCAFYFCPNYAFFFNTKINEFYHKNTIFFSRNLKEILWPENFYPKNLVIVSFCEQSILLIKKKWIRVGRKIILLLLLKNCDPIFRFKFEFLIGICDQIWIYFEWTRECKQMHAYDISRFTQILGTTIYTYDPVF